MLRIPQKLHSFSASEWDSIANVRLMGGSTYHEIVLDTNSQTSSEFLSPADIEHVKVILNGDTILTMTGAQLKMINAYKGLHEEDGIYIIPFGDRSANMIESQYFGALVTFPTDNISLEVKIAAKGTHVDAKPTLEGQAWVSARQDARIWLPRVRTLNFVASASGENTLDTLPRGPIIQKMHIQSAATRLVVRRERLEVFDSTKSINNFNLKQWGRDPQGGYFHFDPTATGFNGADSFDTAVNELDFILTVPAPETARVLLHSVERVA